MLRSNSVTNHYQLESQTMDQSEILKYKEDLTQAESEKNQYIILINEKDRTIKTLQHKLDKKSEETITVINSNRELQETMVR